MVPILYCQYHSCWCHGNLRSKGIIRHGIDQKKLEYISSLASEYLTFNFYINTFCVYRWHACWLMLLTRCQLNAYFREQVELQTNLCYNGNVMRQIIWSWWQWSTPPGGRLNMKMLPYQYRDPQVKDKPVYNLEIPTPGKTVFILRRAPDSYNRDYYTWTPDLNSIF